MRVMDGPSRAVERATPLEFRNALITGTAQVRLVSCGYHWWKWRVMHVLSPRGIVVATATSPTVARDVGEVFRDCDVCPEMMVVPSGRFLMGSPESEDGRSRDDGPWHEVNIEYLFAVGVYEVTFDEWDACVRGGRCRDTNPTTKGGAVGGALAFTFIGRMLGATPTGRATRPGRNTGC